MAKVTGLGGAFLRARDPETLYAWYEQHLGLKREHGCFLLPAEAQRASLVVSFFPQASKYFPERQPAMLNFQVDALDPLLDALIAAGVEVDPKRDRHDYGNFGWFTDPEGNRVELWEPKDSAD
ncbi:VOC family protein [Silvibacterium dinghuense]|uniref:VOC family protein n=1 Tax=Silvibacterium dinghuense TaxID=1560006 RepID=A0A4Q1SE68_9BACT|nr:VOC family protein [Silvibacterium dinghuense]RXS95559.1 VOC family protein [Silvibacterium dinghuense]GGH14022.1 glyoxalase [Silvibacterium dinghuense]